MPATAKKPSPKRAAPVLSFPKGRKVEIFRSGESLVTVRKGNKKRLAELIPKIKRVKSPESVEDMLNAERFRFFA